MMVTGRAFITAAMRICRRGWTVMIVLAATLGNVRTTGELAHIGTEDAGIQPGQRAKNHQPCECQFHQEGRRFHAGHRQLKEIFESFRTVPRASPPEFDRGVG